MVQHDSGYKGLYSHPEMVEDLLRGFVKEEWIDRLDFSTLERVNASFVSSSLKERHDDVIWKVRWGKNWLYVYLLIEFQSGIDYSMAVRIMTYIGLLYESLINEKIVKPDNREPLDGELPNRLPPVLPIVLYNGSKRWDAAKDVRDLVQTVPGGLEKYRPSLTYLLIDEGAFSSSELESLKNLSAALFQLESSQDLESIRGIVERLIDWLKSPSQANLRRSFASWFGRVFLMGRKTLGTVREFEDLSEVKIMLAERVKEWTEQWRNEGLQQGLSRGKLEGLSQMVISQIEEKFGKLSGADRQRFKTADEETLLKWGSRILTIDSVEKIFL